VDLPGAWLSHMFHMADIDRNGLLNFPEFVAAPGQIHGMGMDQCRYFFSHGMIVGYSHEDSVVVVDDDDDVVFHKVFSSWKQGVQWEKHRTLSIEIRHFFVRAVLPHRIVITMNINELGSVFFWRPLQPQYLNGVANGLVHGCNEDAGS